MKTHPLECDRGRIDAFLDSDRFGLEDRELTDHLSTCENCRAYMESRAADTGTWSDAANMLRTTEFDAATTIEFSAAFPGPPRVEQTALIRQVLKTLAPTDDPHRLGRLGEYEVTGVVGAGGMGVVLKAVDPSLDRVVAIKVMSPYLAHNGTARKRFEREAKAAAAVLHPNVIPIHSVYGGDPVPYLVMAYIRGGSLQKRLDREGPLPTTDILRIGAQVAAGLAAAHEQGLIHRDIKPENILLEEGVERVTITDFGLARTVDDSSVTQTGVISGTPRYMSPEQARGDALDQQSDLFSLGSVLYALCTGRPPFRADTSIGVMRRINDETPTPIREINPDIPGWLAQIVEKLMAKDKTQRYASANEVHKLLEACLNHVQQPTQTELPASLRKGQAPTRPRKGLHAFLTSTPGLLIMFATMIAAVSLGVVPMFLPDAAEQAKDAYTQAQAQLDPQHSTGDPANAVNVLLESEHGRAYLVKLDEQYDLFTYDDKLVMDGESAGAVYIWNRKVGNSYEQVFRRSFSKDNQTTGVGGIGAMFQQIHVDGLRIEKDKLIVEYTASSRPQDKLTIERSFGLNPGDSYVAQVNIVDLLDDQIDWLKTFKSGRPMDFERLQGDWNIVEGKDGGKNLLHDGPGMMSVKANALTLAFTNLQEGSERVKSYARLELEHGKQFSAIDLYDSTGTLRAHGIYEFKGETLRLCLVEVDHGERPEKFASPEGSNILLLECQLDIEQRLARDLERLQGEWEAVSVTEHGRKQFAAGQGLGSFRLKFEGNTVLRTAVSPDGEQLKTEAARFELDAAKNLKTIDIFSGDNPGSAVPGIYEVKDGVLKICLNERGNADDPANRPATFDAPAGSGFILMECRRAVEDSPLQAAQGMWEVTVAQKNGKPVSTNDKAFISIEADAFTFIEIEDGTTVEKPMRLMAKVDATQSPNKLELFNDKGARIMAGTFEVKGNNMKLQFISDPDNNRPDQFAVPVRVLELKRVASGNQTNAD